MEQDGQDAPRAQSERPPRHRPLVPVLVGLVYVSLWAGRRWFADAPAREVRG